MTFVRVYLIAYFLLLAGALLALWQAGVLGRISGVWLALGAFAAIGFGILLAIASRPPALRTRD